MIVRFEALEASNPLAFLTALGAFRLSASVWPGARLHWTRENGWRPQISGILVTDKKEFCAELMERGHWIDLERFAGLGNNLTVSREIFAGVARAIAVDVDPERRESADFLAAFGSEVHEERDKNRIEYTDLCFITGSGHQHFLGTARTLASNVTSEHLGEALFGPWKYVDKGLSFRWDPDDAKEYALRWRDPSVGGVSSIWGANRLAFEALPFYPVMPTGKKLRTTAFRSRKRSHEFTWPVWSQPASMDTVRSLVNLVEIQQEELESRAALRAMGVDEIFRVQRVRIGQGANFKVSFRPARAV